ncbi:MAG: hypothetical protein U1F57_10225 [bacterium]
MLPILIIGGLAAVALFGCSRPEEESSRRSAFPTPPAPGASETASPCCHPPSGGLPSLGSSSTIPTPPAVIQFPTARPLNTVFSGYPYQRSLVLRNPRQEYQNLCRTLFNTEDLNQCNRITFDQAMQETPSTERGLNAYYRGIVQTPSSFSFAFADQSARWSPLLHPATGQSPALEGLQLYLSGGACPIGNPGAPTCRRVNDGTEIPTRFDFMDDYYNLVGAFFFLQANQNAVASGAQCTLVSATLGSVDAPFCASYSMHNVVLTPISNYLRGVTPDKLPAGLGTSACASAR